MRRPTLNHEPAPVKEVPPELQCLQGSHVQVVQALFPKAIGNPEAMAMLAGLLAGIGVDFGEPLPEWAKQASKRFWNATDLSFVGKPSPEATPEDFGKLIGCCETMLKDGAGAIIPPQFSRAFEALCQHAKSAINDDPPEVARDFHNGRTKARKIADKANDMNVRTQIFLFIACCWQTVEKFSGQVELWNWLVKKDAAGKSMVDEFAYADPYRELRTICKLIGLRFRKKHKPD